MNKVVNCLLLGFMIFASSMLVGKSNEPDTDFTWQLAPHTDQQIQYYLPSVSPIGTPYSSSASGSETDSESNESGTQHSTLSNQMNYSLDGLGMPQLFRLCSTHELVKDSKELTEIDIFNEHIHTTVGLTNEQWCVHREAFEAGYECEDGKHLMPDLFDYLLPGDFKKLRWILSIDDEKPAIIDKWLYFFDLVISMLSEQQIYRQNICSLRCDANNFNSYTLWDHKKDYYKVRITIKNKDEELADFRNKLQETLKIPLPLHEECNVSSRTCRALNASLENEFSITISPLIDYTWELSYDIIPTEKFNQFISTCMVLEQLLKTPPDQQILLLTIATSRSAWSPMANRIRILSGRQRKILSSLVSSLIAALYIVYFAHEVAARELLSKLEELKIL